MPADTNLAVLLGRQTVSTRIHSYPFVLDAHRSSVACVWCWSRGGGSRDVDRNRNKKTPRTAPRRLYVNRHQRRRRAPARVPHLTAAPHRTAWHGTAVAIRAPPPQNGDAGGRRTRLPGTQLWPRARRHSARRLQWSQSNLNWLGRQAGRRTRSQPTTDGTQSNLERRQRKRIASPRSRSDRDPSAQVDPSVLTFTRLLDTFISLYIVAATTRSFLTSSQ